MHPELESFLNSAFSSVQPTSPEIGRVVVEPDYETTPSQHDAGHLASELVQCLREQTPDPKALASHEGFEADMPGAYRLLSKYVRRITLHQDSTEGPWIEVAPPGNWI
ncbi:MAG: hypothetical protein JO097_10360 [Acidobacteriaceae bacterium]|nr:hypothetical protein [Acidobacteriaceae bacterium]MBV9294031.1 hypothetical protein [Acidobacteriaceae bacterium]MBV9767864.1 hypothetical protein [Acidobacteriaceae bacterium]